MNRIEVGEYIRTKQGHICKIVKKIDLPDVYEDTEGFWVNEIDIKAHSKNIIDLIEVGDIVTTNNLCGEVTKIGKDKLYLACNETCCIDNVETILTHEQYEENCYKVVE